MARPRLKAADLPRTTQARIPILVEQSAPDPNRPRVPEDMERRLSDVERRSAACYASLEDSTVRLTEITAELVKKQKCRSPKKGESSGT